jgi:23S rRNA A2030 N6-methylase RlmJ
LAAFVSVELLRVQLMVRSGNDPQRLNGCGLIVANPPYTLGGSLAAVLPELTFRLAEGPGANHRVDMIEPDHRPAVRPAISRHRNKQQL